MRHAMLWTLMLAAAATAAAEDDGGPPGGGPPPMPAVTVEVVPAVSLSVAAGRTFVGTVEPTRRSLVGSEFGGLVVEYLVKEGDPVDAGKPVARLRTDILDLRLEVARAELRLRGQRLLELENGSRPEEVAQARATLTQLQADLELKRWRNAASKTLFDQNTISEDELRDAALAVRAAELRIEAEKASLALVEAGPRQERVEQGRAEVAKQEAEVRRLEDEKTRYEIRSPFRGWVVREHAEVGQWLNPGSPVAEVVALDEVDVVVDVVEDFVGGLREGLEVRVSLDGVPNRIFTGPIHRIVPSADRRGRTFPVKVRLMNERLGRSVLLKAGMSATASLAVGEERPGVFVPKDAIMLGGPVPVMVWAVGEGNKAEMVPVRLGVAVEDLVEVIGGLQPGTLVVVKGNERIYMPGRDLVVPGAGDPR